MEVQSIHRMRLNTNLAARTARIPSREPRRCGAFSFVRHDLSCTVERLSNSFPSFLFCQESSPSRLNRISSSNMLSTSSARLALPCFVCVLLGSCQLVSARVSSFHLHLCRTHVRSASCQALDDAGIRASCAPMPQYELWGHCVQEFAGSRPPYGAAGDISSGTIADCWGALVLI